MPAPSRAVAHRSAESRAGFRAIDDAASALVNTSREPGTPIVLAVSGGCDSMVMMHAVARALDALDSSDRPMPRVSVATFDHGTGPHATLAAKLVADEGSRLGFDVRAGRAELAGATEAEWRAARWRFFRTGGGATPIVATAHSLDDQIETIVIRVLRDAGARGLAALAAPTAWTMRPFLGIRRQALRRYATSRNIRFSEDPSNESREHLRNRVRLDLLPAIRRHRPRFEEELLALANRAASWRAAVDGLAIRFVAGGTDDGAILVARDELATYDSAALCVLWPAIAARALITLDRRGTRRLAQFTTSGDPGARIQLSGGIEVVRQRDSFALRRAGPRRLSGAHVPLAGHVEFGEWRFSPLGECSRRSNGMQSSAEATAGRERVERGDPWIADLPGDRRLSVREWRPGDRMRAGESGAARRVKRFFGDAHISGPSRAGWPVVLADDEIVWIPGVRRGVAAPERSGRPVVRYACERFVSGPADN